MKLSSAPMHAHSHAILIDLAEYVEKHGAFPARDRFRVRHSSRLAAFDELERSGLLRRAGREGNIVLWSIEALNGIDHPYARQEIDRARAVLLELRKIYEESLHKEKSLEELRRRLGWPAIDDVRRAMIVIDKSLSVFGRLGVYVDGARETFQLYEQVIRLDLDAAFASTVINTEANKVRSMTGIRIFISHAARDAELAKAFIGLLEAGIAIPHDPQAIRCTSVPGFKLEAGDDPAQVLRANLRECAVVIGLLTEAGIASGYVLMELGAAWAFERTACQLLAPGLSFEELPGPFRYLHALKMNDEADLMGLVDTVAKRTGLTRTANSPKEVAALKDFLEVVRRLPAPVARQAAIGKVTSSAKDAAIRMKGWGHEKDRSGSVDFEDLDALLRLTSGLAKQTIEGALAESYDVQCGDQVALLKRKRPTGGTVLHGKGSILDGGDF